MAVPNTLPDATIAERYDKGVGADISAPPAGIVNVSPADDTAITNSKGQSVVLRAFRVGTAAGDVAVVMIDGTTATIPAVQVGETIVGRFKYIQGAGSGTTATGITGWY